MMKLSLLLLEQPWLCLSSLFFYVFFSWFSFSTWIVLGIEGRLYHCEAGKDFG